MKTLIIHPQDKTTSFLDIIYKDIADKTLVTSGATKDEIKQMIKEHDRVMMMGHGSPYGLFSIGQYPKKPYDEFPGYIIEESFCDLLREKEHNVYIWCYASSFVDNHKLRGFSSGMFISEVYEALHCSNDPVIDSELKIKLKTATQDEVDESNYGFCDIVKKHINKETNNIYENVMSEYGLIADNNPVAFYNHERIKMFV